MFHLAGQLHLATLCHQLGLGDIEVEGSDLPLVEQRQHQQGEEDEVVVEPHEVREGGLSHWAAIE